METKDISKKLELLYKTFKEDIATLNVDEAYIKYLGKKGEINKLFDEIKEKTPELLREVAKEINETKSKIIKKISDKKSKVETQKTLIDLTIPVEKSRIGNYHPVNLVKKDLYNFFKYYGFSVYEGPEIETDYYNFEMLGVPEDHPARDLQDTFYILEP